MSDLFYMQDARQIVGNDMVWWAVNGAGYTTDVGKAYVWTKEDAIKQHKERPTDVPWPKAYIDARVRPVVDIQNVNRSESLKDVEEPPSPKV